MIFSRSHLDPGSVEEALENFYHVDCFFFLAAFSSLHLGVPYLPLTPCLDKRRGGDKLLRDCPACAMEQNKKLYVTGAMDVLFLEMI